MYQRIDSVSTHVYTVIPLKKTLINVKPITFSLDFRGLPLNLDMHQASIRSPIPRRLPRLERR